MEGAPRYQLLGRLGQGGMAQVFLARQRGAGGFSRLAVVKRVLPSLEEDPSAVEMLRREARVSALLSHPNVVQVYDFEEIDGAGCLVMEAVEGLSAAELLELRGRLPPPIAGYILACAADGLAAAHDLTDEQGRSLDLVHRDVAPDNMLLGFDGRVKVSDFGVALSSIGPRLTMIGQVKGKIAYMPPEQLQSRKVDRRADVYALGAVLYELLMGKPPFARATDAETMAAAMKERAPMLPAEVPVALAMLVARALEKDPAKRPQSAAAFATELRAALPIADAAALRDFVAAAVPPGAPARERFRGPVEPAEGGRPATRRLDLGDDGAAELSFGPRDESTQLEIATAAAAEAAAPPPAPVHPLRRLWPVLAAGALLGGVAVTAFVLLPGGGSPAERVELPPPTPIAVAPELPQARAEPPPKPEPPPERRPEPAPVPAAKSKHGKRPPHHVAAVSPSPGKEAAAEHPAPPPAPLPPPPRPPAAPGKATLEVKVHPWGRVYIDGREIGLTPLAPQEVEEGHHRVEAVMKGKRVSKEVDAAAGTTLVVKLQIED